MFFFAILTSFHHCKILKYLSNYGKLTGCDSRGEIACPTCNAGQERGFYKENQMTQCSACYGRGLIAHRDGSDTVLAYFSNIL